MARMFPPDEPRGGRNARSDNDAEAAIYAALRSWLRGNKNAEDEYIIFQGLKWFSTNPNGAHQPFREMDFLIVSRRHGLLIVEAKAARIALQGKNGARNSNLNTVREAYFDQAKTLEDELTHFLSEAPLTCKHMASYQIGSAVWFPFSQPWPRDEKATKSVPNMLILDSVDLEQPQAGIERAFAFLGLADGSAWLSDEALDALIETLNQTTLVMQARLSVRIPGAEERIHQLTLEQFEALEALSDYQQLEVRGPAGTGKTVIAYEKAFRLAREGRRVLYLCSNPALSSWLIGMRDRERRPENAKFAIYDLEALCALSSRYNAAPARSGEESLETSRAVQAINDVAREWRKSKDRLYDAILVDEGQDFDTPLWRPLQQLLRAQRTGLMYVFYDPAQRERDDKWSVDLPGKPVIHPLVVNLRNTQAIFSLIQRFYPEQEHRPTICRGEEGAPPVYIDPLGISAPADEEREETALREALRELLDVERLQPEDVLIITCRPRASERYEPSRFYHGTGDFPLGQYVVARNPDIAEGKVALSTIRSARGLERPAVILCELDGLRSARGPKHRAKLLYSAISRAKHKLVVIGSEAQLLGQPAVRQAARTAREFTLANLSQIARWAR